ncbi:MAG: hypothetical protein ABGW87_01390 [Sphingomonadaceae bacterium]
MDDPNEFVPPFISPLTHDQHARLGRIAILWGQIDMMLDLLLESALSLSAKQRRTLIGEKPIGTKLDMLKNHLDELDDEARELATQFWNLANETKTQRNRIFHGVWGFRCGKTNEVTPAATHFKDGGNPVRVKQLAPLEKKLCKTARIGISAVNATGYLNRYSGAGRLFHGAGDTPPWLPEWLEQHPVDDRSLDRRHKRGWLPFLTKPL